MITLHYAEKELVEDIKEIHLKNRLELKKFIKGVIMKDDKETVYLFTSNYSFDEDNTDEYSREIIIESDPFTLAPYVLNTLNYDDCVLFLQEYPSFESAYKVALDMREENRLCYDK